MPKAKKRSGRKTGSRKRKVSGLTSPATMDLVQLVAGAITGAVVKRFGDNILAKQTAIVIDDKLKAFGGFVIGAGAAYFFKQPFLRGIGVGIAAESGVAGLVSLGVLSGSDMNTGRGLVIYQPRPNMSGTTMTPSVGAGSTNAYGFPQSKSGVGKATYAGVYGN